MISRSLMFIFLLVPLSTLSLAADVDENWVMENNINSQGYASTAPKAAVKRPSKVFKKAAKPAKKSQAKPKPTKRRTSNTTPKRKRANVAPRVTPPGHKPMPKIQPKKKPKSKPKYSPKKPKPNIRPKATKGKPTKKDVRDGTKRILSPVFNPAAKPKPTKKGGGKKGAYKKPSNPILKPKGPK